MEKLEDQLKDTNLKILNVKEEISRFKRKGEKGHRSWGKLGRIREESGQLLRNQFTTL